VNKDLFPIVNSRAETLLRRWSVVLLIAACCLALAFAGDAGRTWARYDRTALEGGQAWRMVTAHLVHLGWGHLWPNLLALLLIGGLLEEFLKPAEWLVASVVSAVGISAGLYAFEPDVQWYVGLSGVLHGLVACGAVRMVQARRFALGAALGVGVVAKLVYEATLGPVPFTEHAAGGPVIVAAHLYGAIAGAIAGVAFVVVRRKTSRL
jgi:rhomboid family GlyGly-CTERM serine protease